MTAEQLIIGNKYVPFQKTIGDDFNSSRFVREGLDFLYYIGTNDEGNHMFTVRETSHSGAIYNPEDVYGYIEEHNGIRKGMAVVIQCNLETYSTYTTMFKQLGFINKERNELWSNGTEGVVFAISKASSGTVIFGVRDSYRNECLINASGVRLVDDVVDTKPTKWAIKINPFNKQALADWRGLRLDSTDGYLICDTPQDRPHSLPHNRGYYVMNLNDYPEYTLITDEQFYNQIINKPQTMPEAPQDAPQEEAFVLPEKWQIQITPHNAYMLEVWRGLNIISRDDDAFMLCDVPDGRHASVTRGFVNTTKRQDYTEITTEQFKQYVLNQTPTDMPTQEQTPQTETKQYPKTAEGLYQMTIDLLAFEVGDIVRVTHKVPDNYNGWQNSWSDSMDNFIGNEYKIQGIFETGIQLEYTDGYKFPIYSLELVRRKEPIRTHTLCFTGTDGTMTDGDEFVYFNNPITKLSGNDVYWLVELLKMAGVDKKYSVSTNVAS